MNTYTWRAGALAAGIEINHDARLGPVVFLGEEGRGRRYEKVALSRHRPAEIVAPRRVMNAVAETITLPASNGRPEKKFFVLARPARASEEVLIRINTCSGYLRGGRGLWRASAGDPVNIVSGFGAFGDAGRSGDWKDGLVVLHPGDVLRVFPSRGFDGHSSWAVWLEGGVPQTLPFEEYERKLALDQAEAVIEQAASGETALRLAFGQMPAMTYAGNGKVEAGIALRGGSAIALGEEGRGRVASEIPLVGFTAGERIEAAAVAILSEKERSGAIERLYGLCESTTMEAGAILLRQDAPISNRGYLYTEVFRGQPVKLATGVFAQGAAGHAGGRDDTVWVLRPGDALVIKGVEGNRRVLENRGGQLISPLWASWEETDGQVNPSAYVAKGRAPWGHVPAEWVGSVVMIDGRHQGELIEVRKDLIILNLGWDGSDRRMVTFESGVWVTLHADKVVTAPEAGRTEAQAVAATLRAEAKAVAEQGFFACLAVELQAGITKVAAGRAESSWWDDPQIDFAAVTTAEIRQWIEFAQGVMLRVNEVRGSSVPVTTVANLPSGPAVEVKSLNLTGLFGGAANIRKK